MEMDWPYGRKQNSFSCFQEYGQEHDICDNCEIEGRKCAFDEDGWTEGQPNQQKERTNHWTNVGRFADSRHTFGQGLMAKGEGV